jgi:ankyrin repeat protein
VLFRSAPILDALKYDNMNIVSLLLKNKANIECKNDDGQTLLLAACKKDDIDIQFIKQLIKIGADLSVIDNNGMNVITTIVAANHQCIALLKFVIDRIDPSVLKDLINKNTITKALRNGTEVDDEYENMTPLLCAYYNGNYKCAKLLLEHGADINGKDKSKQTALIYSITVFQDFSLIDLAMEYNADPTIDDCRAHYAAVGDYREIIRKYTKTYIKTHNLSVNCDLSD